MKVIVLLTFLLSSAFALPAHQHDSVNKKASEDNWEDAVDKITEIDRIISVISDAAKSFAQDDNIDGLQVVAAIENAEIKARVFFEEVVDKIASQNLTPLEVTEAFDNILEAYYGEPFQAAEQLYKSNPKVGVHVIATFAAGRGYNKPMVLRLAQIVSNVQSRG